MKFNSQTCTTREQSERLIALGLKKETADMVLVPSSKHDGSDVIRVRKSYLMEEDAIPAWSLHRLIELKEPNTIDNALVILSRKQTYDKLIGIIAKSIKNGHFNKEYLEG